MKDQSIVKVTEFDAIILSRVMGYCDHALDGYIGRYVKIKLDSPKRVKGITGKIYHNVGKVKEG